ncbi:ATP synthase subunit B [Sphingomonas elodea]|uniref:F0F1 ATP synthase subunit B family protein n=1 Tax=Sphingomonas elodea TaxID=179878 RepID=UPI00026302ED|nr:ATP synthase subunit B [Sphingomonas elodea]
MAEQTHSLNAEVGTVELHHEPSVFGITAPGFVALSMLTVVVIILLMKVPSMIGTMLDKQISKIRTQLDEASKLRAEAEAMLADAKARTASAEADAKAVVANAQVEAAAMQAKAEADAAELIARRTRMAEDKIAAAERTAIQAIRTKAADAATTAAAALIAEKHGADADKALVDKTITGLGRLN